jgi:hypothetical protein
MSNRHECVGGVEYVDAEYVLVEYVVVATTFHYRMCCALLSAARVKCITQRDMRDATTE